ncbi:MAG TPA: hypothetical protein VGQ00_04150 [Candidatus Norongarragalinales archaeon]|nr:hypothetical protein [Candidatus Norongarragalinales archaeon]
MPRQRTKPRARALRREIEERVKNQKTRTAFRKASRSLKDFVRNANAEHIHSWFDERYRGMPRSEKNEIRKTALVETLAKDGDPATQTAFFAFAQPAFPSLKEQLMHVLSRKEIPERNKYSLLQHLGIDPSHAPNMVRIAFERDLRQRLSRVKQSKSAAEKFFTHELNGSVSPIHAIATYKVMRSRQSLFSLPESREILYKSRAPLHHIIFARRTGALVPMEQVFEELRKARGIETRELQMKAADEITQKLKAVGTDPFIVARHLQELGIGGRAAYPTMIHHFGLKNAFKALRRTYGPPPSAS